MSLSNLSLHGLGKSAVLILNNSKSKNEWKFGKAVLESHSQILEETRRLEDLAFEMGKMCKMAGYSPVYR